MACSRRPRAPLASSLLERWAPHPARKVWPRGALSEDRL